MSGRRSQGPMPRWEASRASKAYALLATIEALGLVGICVAALVFGQDEPDDVRYVAITAIAATLGFLYFALDSILLENQFQFWASIVCHLLIDLFVIYNYVGQVTESRLFKKASLGLMIAVSICQATYIALGPYVNNSFGWFIYKRVGPNPHEQELYRTAQVFFSVLKLDFLLNVILVLLASFYLYSAWQQYVLNIGASALTFAWAIMGFLAVRRENLRLVYLFVACALVEPAYIAYKFYAVFSKTDESLPESTTRQFAIIGGLCFVTRILVMWRLWTCVRIFDQGLLRIWARRRSAGKAVNVTGEGEAEDDDPVASSSLHDADGLAAFGPQRLLGAMKDELVEYTAPLTGSSSACVLL